MWFEVLRMLAVFGAYFIIDAFYALYTRAVNGERAVRAANIGAVMHFLLAFGVVSYNNNWLYIFPLAAGSWLGTWYVVRRESRKNKKRVIPDTGKLLTALEENGISDPVIQYI